MPGQFAPPYVQPVELLPETAARLYGFRNLPYPNCEMIQERDLRMKKTAITALITALFMLAGIFAACAGKPAGHPRNSETESLQEEKGEHSVSVSELFTPVYPNGSTKAFTLGFDDGVDSDRKLIELCEKYGLRCCTFMLNAGNTTNDVDLTVNGFPLKVHFYGRSEIKDAYRGAEVAGHGRTHLDLTSAGDIDTLISEIKGGNDVLSEIVGYDVVGFAYPYGTYNDLVIKALKRYGVLYARTCTGTGNATLPENFLEWNPTCINLDPNVPAYVQNCIDSTSTELQCIYVWGHAGELDCGDGYLGGTRWDDMEALLKQVSESGTFWAATNGEIAAYVTAVRSLTIEENGISNSSDITVYGKLNGEKVEIKAGTTLSINK